MLYSFSTTRWSTSPPPPHSTTRHPAVAAITTTDTTRNIRSRHRSSPPTPTCSRPRGSGHHRCSHRRLKCFPISRTTRWSLRPRTSRCPSSTAGQRRASTEACRAAMRRTPSRSTRARSAARTTPPAPTCPGTSRRTEASIPGVPRSATSAARCTSPCPPYLCTSWPTISTTNATSVVRLSQDPGFSRAIWGPTRARSLTCAPSARSASPTGPTWGRICRPIRRRKTFSVQSVRRRSRSSRTWTSTTSRPAFVATDQSLLPLSTDSPCQAEILDSVKMSSYLPTYLSI